MKKKLNPQSAFFNPRFALAFFLCLTGVFITLGGAGYSAARSRPQAAALPPSHSPASVAKGTTLAGPTPCMPPSFAPASNFGAGSAPFSVAAGDFDGDGNQDLAAVNAGSNNVSILLGGP